MELTQDNIHRYLYGETPIVLCCYDEDGVSSTEAAHVIHEEIHKQTPNDCVRIVEATGGWLPGQPEWDYAASRHLEVGSSQWNEAWDKYEEAVEAYRSSLVADLTKQWGPNMDIYTFEFSDNDGPFWSTLEHGGTFNGVPHLTVSNH